jgi:replicative DNA helicase
MMLSTAVARLVSARADERWFRLHQHRVIFRAISDAADFGAVDWLTVKSNMPPTCDVPEDYILQLCEIVPSAANWEYYAGIVYRQFQRRAIIDEAGRAEDEDYTVRAEFVETLTGEMSSRSVLQLTEIDLDSAPAHSCIRTGVAWLDDATGGVPLGEYAMFLGGSGVGKSNFLIGRAIAAAEFGHPVLYLTLADLDERRVKERMMKMLCGWSSRPVAQPFADDWRKASDHLNKLDIVVHATHTYRNGNDVDNLIGIISAARKKHGVQLVILDYAQMIDGGGSNRYDASVEAQQKIHSLCNRLKIACWIGSQVTETDLGPRAKGGEHWKEGAAIDVIAHSVPRDVADKKGWTASLDGREGFVFQCRKSRYSKKPGKGLFTLNENLNWEFVMGVP